MTAARARTFNDYLNVLRAVDREGLESASQSCWSFTSTVEIAARLGKSVQWVTPLLGDLVKDGHLTRTEQPDGTLTWHLRGEWVCKMLRAENEVVVQRGGQMSRA